MSTNEIILAFTVATLVVFSLVVSLVVPKRNPDFPGKKMGAFFLVAIVLVAGMLTAVNVVGKESEATAAPTESTQPGETTTATETAPTGDSAAGKAVFAAQGCGGCHAFAPAGSSGAVGPKLDDLAGDASAVGQPLAEFVRASITDPGSFVPPGYADGIMPKTFGSLSPEDLDNLVAFVLSGQPPQ